MSEEQKPARLVEDVAALARRQPMVRKYNEVVYKPMRVEALEILPPLERAIEVERIADARRMSAALAIANLIEADLTPRPDEIDAFALLSKEWREAHERRQELQAEADQRAEAKREARAELQAESRGSAGERAFLEATTPYEQAAAEAQWLEEDER